MPSSLLGSAVRRTEDPRFLTGAARYVDDVPADSALHAVFVRSFLAHARLGAVDASGASSMPGVAGVFTAADLDLSPMKSAAVSDAFWRPPLARDVVRFVGEAVAVVLAESRAGAADAAEAVTVDYEPLPVLVDPELALDPGAPVLFPDHGSNVALDDSYVWKGGTAGAAMEGADVVVTGRFLNQRLAVVPMEVNGALAVPDPESGGLTVWLPVQAPHWARSVIAEKVGLPNDQVRVVAPAVGGGFGAKINSYPEHVVVAALAHRLGRPVRYVETRSENLLAMTHGRAQIQDVEIGATRDGTITGLRVRVIADLGAYPADGAFLPPLTQQMACGPYRIPRLEFHSFGVATNTTPVDAYRGAGRPEATALIERAMDMVAAELHMDPAEIRRRNFIPPEAFPITTAADAEYDTGEYERSLDLALELAGYDELRREQAERRVRGDGRQLGIGVGCYVEVTGLGGSTEFGSVEVNPDGTVTVLSGTAPQGHGHETAWAQIVASTLGVSMEAVTVVHSDTATVPRGDGTMGSRSLQIGGSAALRAGLAVVEKARRLAAHLLEAAVDDVVLIDDGRVGLAGAPDRAFTWGELATAAAEPARLPQGMEPGLEESLDFMPDGRTYPFGTHVSVVEVDTETGFVRPRRHVAVDDCGRIVNPMLVEGQVHGGAAQGIAQALYEEVRYDEDGNPLTANLMSYAMPSMAELPSFETANTETPTPRNPLGAKGIGESGTIGSTPAVQNAVIDALAPFGVRHLDMPLTPERVWRAIHGAG